MRVRAFDLAVAATILIGSTAVAMADAAVAIHSTLGANGLVLDGAGSSSTRIVKVAELSVSTDDADGFALSITSGSLTRAGGTPITFQVVLVERGAGAPSSGSFTTSSGDSFQVSTTSAGTVERDLYIKYRAAALQDPGAYTAAIHLDVVDN